MYSSEVSSEITEGLGGLYDAVELGVLLNLSRVVAARCFKSATKENETS